MNLLERKDLIENYPMHIATVTPSNMPNLAVAADVKVIGENKIIISHNEMVSTPKNIVTNNNIVLTSFNENWEGLRITGTATYYKDGEYYDFCKKTFFSNGETNSFGETEPRGAILVTVEKIEEMK